MQAVEPHVGDPNWSNVSLLIHADSAITDSSSYARALTVVGNAAITTAQQKFGAGSLTFDGSGDRLNSVYDTALTFGTGDFTVEAWCRFVSKTDNQSICGIWTLTTSWFFYLEGGLKLRTTVSGSSVDYVGSFVPTLGQWYHVAAARNSTATRIFVNGTAISTTTEAPRNIAPGSGAFTIGAISNSGSFPSYDYNGQIDELRITKGVCRYPANFTPPTAAFPDGPFVLAQLGQSAVVMNMG